MSPLLQVTSKLMYLRSHNASVGKGMTGASIILMVGVKSSYNKGHYSLLKVMTSPCY